MQTWLCQMTVNPHGIESNFYNHCVIIIIIGFFLEHKLCLGSLDVTCRYIEKSCRSASFLGGDASFHGSSNA